MNVFSVFLALPWVQIALHDVTNICSELVSSDTQSPMNIAHQILCRKTARFIFSNKNTRTISNHNLFPCSFNVFFGDIILIGNLSRILKAYLRTVRRVSHASFFTFCLFLGVNCPSSIWHYNRLECTPDIFATRGTSDAT